MTLFADRKLARLGIVFCILSAAYALFSYSLTDPNLILTSWPPYWQFQQWAWQTFFHNRPLQTAIFVVLIVTLFIPYLVGGWWLEKKRPHKTVPLKTLFIGFLLSFLPLFFSYNALSHDVFNYMFNAKMVLVYQSNPHTKVALDFAYDPWTRFMHNTHTPAPYGYGWTALSLLPSLAGIGRLVLTWVWFRIFALASVGFLLWSVQAVVRAAFRTQLSVRSFWWLFCNPLLVIEIVSNQHNDLWMMAFALWAFAYVARETPRFGWQSLVASAGLLAVSVSIKLATLALVPVWGLFVLRSFIPSLKKKLSVAQLFWLASASMFVPLLTTRSQQFLPWYLVWSLVWLPIITQRWWKTLLVTFSLSALLRYVPWLWEGGFGPLVITQQKYLVWVGGIGGWLLVQGWRYFRSMR